ncbi:MAG: 3-phosphoshikimate 1-carboxyvinyltransferase [Candidatus Zeuxoniibacter abyssi]|nr:MAG: 3-phosphoshikimate 1-carboxyvinyltransferase [Candidatus Persebacteraceae bacterium AB1(2)]
MKKHILSPGGELNGELRVVSDKSITHRALLLAALAQGESEITHPLLGDDLQSTIAALRFCGVLINEEEGRLYVHSDGVLHIPDNGVVNCGNSGTLMRIFCGVAVGANIAYRLIGDDSLMQRPMRRVAWPLCEMGAKVEVESSGKPPIVLEKHQGLRGIRHNLKTASAQVKSALLLAGLRAEGETTVEEPLPSRDHTELMLKSFGVVPKRDGALVSVQGGTPLNATGIKVPADISSAAFFMVGAAMTPGSDLTLTNVGINPTRFGAVEIIRRMGADVDVINVREYGNELVADIRVCGSELHGIDIEADLVPSAIDDFPALLIAAAAAIGKTTLSGATELRNKESDRIGAMVEGLLALGVECEERKDGIVVRGAGDKKNVFSGGKVQSRGDHRIAMAFSIAALRAADEIVVENCDNVSTSFPGFAAMAREVGLRIAVEED